MSLIIANKRVYKRDNKTVAQIKYLRDYKCQLCNTTIIKEDGTFYIEAAHINAKHQGGNEVLNNILILCPNHHKEFDLGKRENVRWHESVVEFLLNDKHYKIQLALK